VVVAVGIPGIPGILEALQGVATVVAVAAVIPAVEAHKELPDGAAVPSGAGLSVNVPNILRLRAMSEGYHIALT